MVVVNLRTDFLHPKVSFMNQFRQEFKD
jgi:hypothetical protein